MKIYLSILLTFFAAAAWGISTRYIDADGFKSSDHSKTWALPGSSGTISCIACTESPTNKTHVISSNTWSGQFALVNGGTASDLSATGGTSQVLKQTSAGAAITVARLACSDLSNAATSCATDATNASNISSGTLPAGRLPNPSASTLGGVESYASVSHQWINTISTSGVPSSSQPAFTDISGSCTVAQGCVAITSATLGDTLYASAADTWSKLAGNTTSTKKFLSQTGTGTVSAAPAWGQPAFTDITGSVAASQLPNPSSSSLGGVQSAASVSHQWINSISTSGVPALSQPAFTDISGSVAASQMPALTGDVTSSAGAVATTIANSAVTNAKIANGTIDLTAKVTGILPIANGGTNAAAVTTSPNASSWAGWDSHSDLNAQAFIPGLATNTNGGGTVTLTVSDGQTQYFSGGTNAETLNLPVVTTMTAGQYVDIKNYSTGTIAVKTSGGNTLQTMAASTYLRATVKDTTAGTGTASWFYEYGSLTNGATAITALTGDVTASGPGSVAATAAATQNNITSIPNLVTTGTITNGVWNGTAVVVTYGGTGRATLTNHGVLVGAGTSAITQLSAAASGTVLTGQGSSSDPSFTATPTLGVAGTTKGTLAFTGNTSGTISLVPQAAAGTWEWDWPITAGSAGQVLTSQGGAGTAMTWTAALTNPMTTGGDIIYGGSAGAATRLANGSANQYLASAGGTSAPVWTSFTAPTVTRKTTGTSATYTTPTSPRTPLYLKVKMVGPGGGGAGSGTVNSGGAGTTPTNSTIFGDWTAAKGSGAQGTSGGAGPGGTGGTNTVGTGILVINATGATGQSGNYDGDGGNAFFAGGNGASSMFGGAGANNNTGVGNAAVAAGGGGAGGGYVGGGVAYTTGGGGGAGGYEEFIITSPSATYTYTVGAGGAGGSAGTGAGAKAGAAGADGIIIIEEYYQ